MNKFKDLEKAVLAVMLGQKEEQLDEAKKPLHPNQQKLDVHEPEKDELTAKDFEMLRKGKKVNEAEMKDMEDDEEEDDDEDEDEDKKKEMKEARFQKGEDIGKPGKNFAKIAKAAGEKYGSKEAGQRVAGAVLKKVLAKEETEAEAVDEADETVIVHNAFEYEIKESYTFGDYLSTAKKLVGEEAAIELANKAFKDQDTSIFVEEFTRGDIEGRIKAHEKAGHKVSMPKYSTKSGKPHAEYIVTDKESGVRRKYIHHGNMRNVENMGTAGKKDE